MLGLGTNLPHSVAVSTVSVAAIYAKNDIGFISIFCYVCQKIYYETLLSQTWTGSRED